MQPATVPHIVRPNEIRDHLTNAAMGRSVAFLTASYHQVPGTFSAPDRGGRVLFFSQPENGGGPPQIDIGQSVRVDYRFDRSNLVFFSRISEFQQPGSWVLDRPRTVQRLSRRQEPRVVLSEDQGFALALMTANGFQSFPLMDLSSGGAALMYDAREVGLWVGRQITAWIDLPNQQTAPVSAIVRHVSRTGCSVGHKCAGLRFVDLEDGTKRLIAGSLSRI
jgi:hypothetical protein